MMLVNNTSYDLSEFRTYFLGALKGDGTLPPELADLFTMEVVEVNGERRGIIGFAADTDDYVACAGCGAPVNRAQARNGDLCEGCWEDQETDAGRDGF